MVKQSSLDFVFTDGHAIMRYSSFFTNLADLNKIDWQLMDSKYWNDIDSDSDRKRRRQAEFLVRKFFPWGLITEIGAKTAATARKVKAVLSANQPEHSPETTLKREWYY